MASPRGDNGEIERSQTKSPGSQMDTEELMDDKTAHLEKISDWKTYCKVRHFSIIRKGNLYNMYARV